MTGRPAETATGLAAAIAILISYLLSIDDPIVYGALIVVLGAVPGVVTWIVELSRRGNDGAGKRAGAAGAGEPESRSRHERRSSRRR